MDASTFDLFHQERRILCKCPNPDCGKISRLSEIDIKSGRKSKPTYLDEYEDKMDGYYADNNEYLITKKKNRQNKQRKVVYKLRKTLERL